RPIARQAARRAARRQHPRRRRAARRRAVRGPPAGRPGGRRRRRRGEGGAGVVTTLIVEDDFRVARLHAEVVDALDGYSVAATVHTASAALDAVRRHRPRLVLLDLYLPDASGLEVLRRLRALGEPPDVIVLSAAREMHSVRAAMQGGALHYLIKPFDFDDLRARLIAYAELDAARSAERETHQQEVDRLFGLIRR